MDMKAFPCPLVRDRRTLGSPVLGYCRWRPRDWRWLFSTKMTAGQGGLARGKHENREMAAVGVCVGILIAGLWR